MSCMLSGKYCAVHWPESLYYVVYIVSREVGIGEDTLKVVDSGQCYSLAWLIAGVGGEEYCIIVSPNKRIDGSKKKKFTFFGQRNDNPEGCLPSLIVMKYYSSDRTAVDIVCSGAPDDVLELFGGSVLLCVTSPNKTSDASVAGEKKAVSKIEAEAIAAQSAADEKPSVGGADIPPCTTYASQFYYVKFGKVPGDTENSTIPTMLNPELHRVGPLMSRVSAVSFDSVRKCSSMDRSYQHVAVLIASKINILSAEYTTVEGKVVINLRTLSTIELQCSPTTIPCSLRWWNSVLFAGSSHSIRAYAIGSGHASGSTHELCGQSSIYHCHAFIIILTSSMK